MSRFKICPRCEKICVPKPSGLCKFCVQLGRIEKRKEADAEALAKSRKKDPTYVKYKDPIYVVWKRLRYRCRTTKNRFGHNVRFDYRWEHSFVRFRGWLLKRGYIVGKSRIARYDEKKGFYPANCYVTGRYPQVPFVASSYDPYEIYPWLGTKKQKAKREAEKSRI